MHWAVVWVLTWVVYKGAPVRGWSVGRGRRGASQWIQLGQPVDGLQVIQLLATSAASRPLSHLISNLQPRPPLFTSALQARKEGVDEEENIRVTLCRSLEDLSRAIWREVIVEGAGRDWASGLWRRPAGERLLGLSTRLMRPDLVFLLVEYRRYSSSGELRGGVLHPELAAALQHLTGSTNPTPIVSTYGSHFVKSFSTGDSLHQVLVFEKSDYEEIKMKLLGDDWREVAEGRGAVGMGKVISASGSVELMARLEDARRRLGGPLVLWPVVATPRLRHLVQGGLGSAVLGFTLTGLQALVAPPSARSLKEYVNNRIALTLANL